ncbi:MAG: DUF4342 domain-containing protein [Syntrophomonadaceae bacterium]|jgi:nucleoid DNA-binding protein|nr:DUF4342 domain-containing protein [Syntrophomonadaceae bacterium]
MTTLENVEKICAMANISYEEAKAVLDAVDGDLLEAVISLEKQGKIQAPNGAGYFSSEKAAESKEVPPKTNSQENHYYNNKAENSFGSFVKKVWKFCLKIIHKGNINSFEVFKDMEVKASFPVTVLALLTIFAFWVTIPLMIIGLFFDLRYRFVGPDFKSDTINDAMNSAAEAADNLKKSINNM